MNRSIDLEKGYSDAMEREHHGVATIYTTGNVGMQIIRPAYPLHVVGEPSALYKPPVKN